MNILNFLPGSGIEDLVTRESCLVDTEGAMADGRVGRVDLLDRVEFLDRAISSVF